VRSDTFLRSDRVGTRSSRTGVLIDQFHCHEKSAPRESAVTQLRCR
jgi:hypothetical protein